MGSKSDEFSDETFRDNASSYPIDEVVSTKSKNHDTSRHPTGEPINLISVRSSHNSNPEDAEGKAKFNISDASGVTEMPAELSETVKVDLHASQCDDHKSLATMFEDQKRLEVHDDTSSCISVVNEVDKHLNCDIENADRINTPCCAASTSSLDPETYGKVVDFQKDSGCLETKCNTDGNRNNPCRERKSSEESIYKVSPHISSSNELTSHNSISMEIPSSKDIDDGASSLNGQITTSNPPSGISLCSNSILKNAECLGKNHPSELTELLSEKLHSLSENELEAKIDEANNAGDHAAESVNPLEQIQIDVMSDMKEALSQSHSVDNMDESDNLEHDVKVCDICGDAGREDLLAICCMCSDGAEHTYCMREMLDKVPEGDWLCEECKFNDDIKSPKQDKVGLVCGYTKNLSSGHATTEATNLSMKLDGKGSDSDGNRNNKDQSSAKVSAKRPAEDLEVSSVAKKQALEPVLVPSKASSPNRVSILSRDSSFKNVEKGKPKPVHAASAGSRSVTGSPDMTFCPAGLRSQTPRGTFSKSNSFNSSNVKPKVKLVDDVAPQKQKLVRESSSFDLKRGPSRLISKSMSFKSSNSSHFTTDSKLKVLSPKLLHVQDLKGLKHSKEQNLFERKSSFKSDRSMLNSGLGGSSCSTPKGDQNPVNHGESISLPCVINNRELKVVQSDCKSISSSKPTVHVGRRGSEKPVPSGEVKRHSSANGISISTDRRSLQASPKDDSSSSSCIAERPLCNGSEAHSDGLHHPRDSSNVGEKIRDSSGSRSRQSITDSGRSIQCQKCKEVGHSTKFCTVDSSRSFDASSASSMREELHKGSKLKAAIEAAMLKKPGIYRKCRAPEQPDELSVPSMNYEIASQDQLASSCSARSMICTGELHEGQGQSRNSTSDSSRQTVVNSLKKSMALSPEAVTCRVGDANPVVPTDGKLSIRDTTTQASAAISSLLKMSAIPLHESIWQGHFEIHRSGKVSNLCDGIQAHLSVQASPKVLEMVNKFPSKFLLEEVPRMSTWPIQFEENGVREDNIALYFFAKDLESYENSYRILMESMMRSDLALKGNIGDAELLIFPSNQLPENSQRWNMLFFLWGVFRGKRADFMPCIPSLPENSCIFGDIPEPTMSLPKNICSLRCINKDSPVCKGTYDVGTEAEAPALIGLSGSSSTGAKKLDCDTNLPSLNSGSEYTHINVEQQNCRLESNCLSAIRNSSMHICPEFKSSTVSQEEHADANCKSVQLSGACDGSNRSEKMAVQSDVNLDRPPASSVYWGKVSASSPEVDSVESFEEKGAWSDTTVKTSSHHGKRPHLDGSQAISHAAAVGTSQTMAWNDNTKMLDDGVSASKKQKSGFSGFYGHDSHTSSSKEGFGSEDIYDMVSSSPVEGKGCDEAYDMNSIPETSGNAERYFFPVDPVPKDNTGLDDRLMPWKVFSSNEDMILDLAPNLELALGAEMKSSKQAVPPFISGMVDNKINQEQPPENAASNDEDVAASLSLSLSFPFPDKEETAKPVSKSGQLLAERQHVNTSLLLFGGFADK